MKLCKHFRKKIINNFTNLLKAVLLGETYNILFLSCQLNIIINSKDIAQILSKFSLISKSYLIVIDNIKILLRM